MTKHTLDTDSKVFFYEQEFYVLSNFSAFKVKFGVWDYDTAEHCYHCQKFAGRRGSIEVDIQACVRNARSAHDSFKIAQANKDKVRPDWNAVRVGIMGDILRAKVNQHEYVRRKLLETGERELIEHSWRDSFWGWGPDRQGQNMLGKLWMEIRAELRDSAIGRDCYESRDGGGGRF